MPDGERRIVVEICNHQELERLRADLRGENEQLRSEISRLEQRVLGLHRTLYEVIETIGNLRGKRS